MIGFTLSKDQLHVEPGSAVTLTVAVKNHSNQADRYELDVEGLDSEWVAIPAPSFTLAPGEERIQKILLKPPRTAESKAGSYPFVVRTRSLESGDSQENQAILDIEPFHLVSLEIEPRRATAGYFKKQNMFSVTVINLGNTEETLQLFADDPEDACTYQFAHERIQLSPGQQKRVALSVQPSHMPIVGAARLDNFHVSGRSVENPHVVASAQAQLERRALLAPASLIVLILLIMLASAWYAFRPKEPTIDSFAPDKTEVLSGESVTLSWSSTNAKYVTIEANGEAIFSKLPPEGQVRITVEKDTTFYASAVNDIGESQSKLEVQIKIKELEAAALPVIEEFSVKQKTIQLGNPVSISYRVVNAERVILQPMNIDLPVNLEEYTITPQQAGRIELTLVAVNREGKATRATTSLTVEQTSKARIFEFVATYNGNPISPDDELEAPAMITLSWQVTSAVRIDIQPRIGVVSAERGTMETTIDKTTTFTLTATDSDGVAVSQKLTVKVKPQRIIESEIRNPN